MKYPGRNIKKGETDKTIIKAVQTQLNKKGYGPLDVSVGVFGPKTVSAVKLFQTQNTDQNGNLLSPDGVIGAITWAVLFGENTVPQNTTVKKKLHERAIEIASSQIGVREKGSANCGPEVEKYLASIGLGKGYSWCMAFVFWCFNEAAKELGQPNPLVKTGGVLKGWNESKGTKILAKNTKQDPSLVKPGQIFIMDHGSGFGHTGIVKEVNGGFITTIEGNTNDNHSREGVGVFQLIRKVKDINKGFIQY
ncbi:MAG: CHAP domain-containing protein [Flavobacterium sp.]|nr:CHAP domain-containing protein [Flavobacterium sp.]